MNFSSNRIVTVTRMIRKTIGITGNHVASGCLHHARCPGYEPAVCSCDFGKEQYLSTAILAV